MYLLVLYLSLWYCHTNMHGGEVVNAFSFSSSLPSCCVGLCTLYKLGVCTIKNFLLRVYIYIYIYIHIHVHTRQAVDAYILFTDSEHKFLYRMHVAVW